MRKVKSYDRGAFKAECIRINYFGGLQNDSKRTDQ